MRPIKFRAKRIDNDDYVYGYYFVATAESLGENVLLGEARICHCILTEMDDDQPTTRFFVDPTTLGQFTGLLDRNGTEIYEGDILKCHCDGDPMPNTLVEYKCCGYWIDLPYGCHHDSTSLTYACTDNYVELEVISNIHTNPELLEVNSNE